MSIDGWIDKEDLVCVYNRILLSHQKKWHAICSDMDGPGDGHTQWNKSEKGKYSDL